MSRLTHRDEVDRFCPVVVVAAAAAATEGRDEIFSVTDFVLDAVDRVAVDARRRLKTDGNHGLRWIDGGDGLKVGSEVESDEATA